MARKYAKMIREKDVLICSDKSNFEDDKIGKCTNCEKIIFFRPYNEYNKDKMCWDCALKI